MFFIYKFVGNNQYVYLYKSEKNKRIMVKYLGKADRYTPEQLNYIKKTEEAKQCKSQN